MRRWFVKCEVNMGDKPPVTVLVRAEKPSQAMQLAEAECRNNGYWHARAFYCKELERCQQ